MALSIQVVMEATTTLTHLPMVKAAKIAVRSGEENHPQRLTMMFDSTAEMLGTTQAILLVENPVT